MESSCYCANIRHSAQLLAALYDQGLAPCGLSLAQYRLLSRLSSLGQANLTQWAEAAGIERTTMVRNVRTLEASGWLERAAGSGKTYTLSEAGQALVARAKPHWAAVQKHVEDILGKDDAQALLRIHAKLEERGAAS